MISSAFGARKRTRTSSNLPCSRSSAGQSTRSLSRFFTSTRASVFDDLLLYGDKIAMASSWKFVCLFWIWRLRFLERFQRPCGSACRAPSAFCAWPWKVYSRNILNRPKRTSLADTHCKKLRDSESELCSGAHYLRPKFGAGPHD